MPQFGQRRSSTSPQTAQKRPPAGSAAALSGRARLRPSTWYLWFEGQLGFGQNPVCGETTMGLATAGGGSLEPVDISMPNFFDSLVITSSLSFVPSPLSNIEMADCLQPTSAANSPCEILAVRRASRTLLQKSGFKFVIACYQHYQQNYQLINNCLYYVHIFC